MRLRPLLVLALFLLPIVAPVMPAHAAIILLTSLCGIQSFRFPLFEKRETIVLVRTLL